MLAFLLFAVALVALTLVFVLPPLWNDARRSAIAMLLAIPLGAVGLYAAFGTPDGLDPAQREIPETIEQAIVQLEHRLQREPDSLEGWVLLGRAHKSQGRDATTAGDASAAMASLTAAVDAFRRARELAPDDIDLMVETAEALSLANAERRFEAEATTLLDQALVSSPNHRRALWFRGIAAVQAGEPADAVGHWETLLPLVDEATAAALREQIAGARLSAGMPPTAEASPSAVSEPAPGTPGTLTVSLDADAQALAALPAEAVLFVFARNADAGGPPVAVRRIPGARLPLRIVLSDADRLMPTASLSTTPRVEVSARFARSGAVTPEAGDLVAAAVVVELAGAAPIALTLSASDAPTDAARAPTFGQ